MDRRAFLKSVPAAAAVLGAANGFGAEGSTGAASETAAGAATEAGGAASTSQTSGAAAGAGVGNLKPIELTLPGKEGGKSVVAALWERKTNRNVGEQALTPEELSTVLWAAWGVNRPEGVRGKPGRTAATASNSQEIDLYAVMADGVYLYDGPEHKLTPVVEGDHRGSVGRRRGGAMAKAPLILVFVADLEKYKSAPFQEPGLKDAEIQKSYYNIAIGMIAANVHLYAAATGLTAWFHNCNKPELTQLLKLGPQQRVVYGQTVGHERIVD